MFTNYLKARDRWFAFALLLLISCAAGARTPQELSGQDAAGWPKTFEARGSKFVVYEPQLESFKGSRLMTRAAVSITRDDGGEPVFGGIWLDAVLSTDPDTKIATPIVIKVTDVRFPGVGTDEAARLRQEFGDEITRWHLKYPVEALIAELKLLEEQKAAAQDLKAEVPQILFRTGPAVLLSLQDEPAWRPTADKGYERLENSPLFVVRDTGDGLCYLHVPPFWWTATDPLGNWKTAADAPNAVDALWAKEPKPQVPVVEDGGVAPARPEVIPVSRPTELVWTDGEPAYAPISGTDLLYVKNTDSDVFLDIQSQMSYALFSGRWYRTPQSKVAWEFTPSDQLPADFARIPLGSEKRHVLACVAGTVQAKNAVRAAEIPQTEGVKPGPAPDLNPAFDGEPQFTNIPNSTLTYAVNTPYSIFCADRRYYWCYDGIWYDADYSVGPWFVCGYVPRTIYLIPPSCPHYYVTYCHVFSVSPSVICFGYYPGYRGCYVWGSTVVYGTGWGYRPWRGNCWYGRPVTWGLGVRYSGYSSGWSIRLGSGCVSSWGIRRPSNVRGPSVQVGAGGWWGGSSYGVQSYLRSPSTTTAAVNLNPGGNLYTRQPDRRAPNPAHPSGHAPAADRDHDSDRPQRGGPSTTPPARHDPARAPQPDRETPRLPQAPHEPREESRPMPPQRETPRPDREAPRTPPQERDVPRTPPPQREAPRTPPPQDREIPRTPPPQREAPRTPPPQERETPRTPPPQREAPRTPPPQEREIPRTPPPQRETPRTPPPQQREQREAPRQPPSPPPQQRNNERSSERNDRRRSAPPSLKSGGESAPKPRQK